MKILTLILFIGISSVLLAQETDSLRAPFFSLGKTDIDLGANAGVTPAFVKLANALKNNSGYFDAGDVTTDIVVNGKTIQVKAHVSYSLDIIDASKEHNIRNNNGIPRVVVEQNNQTDEEWTAGVPAKYNAMTESMLPDGENVARIFDTELFQSKATILKNYAAVSAGEPGGAKVYSLAEQVYTFLHEMSHLFGFKDQYVQPKDAAGNVTGPAVPNPGYEHDLTGTGSVGLVTWNPEHNIEVVKNYIKDFILEQKKNPGTKETKKAYQSEL